MTPGPGDGGPEEQAPRGGPEGATAGARLEAAEEAARASEARFRALTLLSGDIISLLDAEGRLLFNSPATERINGFTPAELAGRDTFDLIHPEDRAHVQEVFRAVLRSPGEVHTARYRYRTKDGRWLWMEAVASNHLGDPDVRGIVANSRDISERVQAEEERRRLEAQLLHVQKLESLGVLAGGVAHDFNNLLAVILGEASLLTEDVSPEARPAVDHIVQAASRASELTRLLLAYAGKERLEKAAVSFPDLVRDLRPLLELSAGKRCRVRFELPEALPAFQGDAGQLRQVLLNLVLNAAEATAPGGGEIVLRAGATTLGPEDLAACVTGTALGPGRVVYLEVEDRGAGMPPETAARIFDPFFTTKEGGRGLGLSAVVGIVHGHGGALRVRTAPGAGATFTVYVAPTAPARAPADAPTRDAGRWHGRALVVDDDPDTSRVTQRLLAHLGFEVMAAADGRDALARHGDALQDLALVVLDMVMPGLDGTATLRELRKRRPGLPVLLYSGFDGDAAAVDLLQPRTAFLGKPAGLVELKRALEDLL